MERTNRLRRYLRKDYTQLVDFPVEIVGRDGQVRRYSYDDSVQLYQRRVRSAPIRFDDSELIEAESRHCRQRIDQLRRSFVERHGWGGLREGLVGGICATPLAAEVISFLRRVFPDEGEGETALELALVASDLRDVCWLRCRDTGRTWILYLWRLEGPAPSATRDDFRATLRQLASAPPGDTVERLHVVHEGPDAAILLAGTGEWDGDQLASPPDSRDMAGPGEWIPDEGDPWIFAQRALQDGAVGEAVRILEQGMEAVPLRRVLPQAAGLLAILDNQPERAEYATRYGRVQHPNDVLLAYLFAVALCRQARFAEAAVAITDLPQNVQAAPPLRLLRGVLELRAGRFFRGIWRLAGLQEGGLPVTAERCRRWLLHLTLGVNAALLAALGVIGLAELVGLDQRIPLPSAAVMGLTVLIALAATALVERLRATRVLLGTSPAEVRLVSLELLPREREHAADN